MKKAYLKSFFVLLAITIVISCTKELMDVPIDALTIEKAKAWYEMQKTTPVMMLKSSKADRKTDCTPDWEKAFASSNDDFEVIEAPLTSQTKFSFSTQESLDLSKKNNEPGYLNSNSRFVIQKNKKTGLREGYIMTIVGDAGYLKTKKFQLSNNSYLKKDKDFSGYVLFHNLDGTFENGWQYKKGKVSGSMTSDSSDQSSLRLKSSAPVEQAYELITIYEYTDNYIDFYNTSGGYTGTTYLGTTATIVGTYIVCTGIVGGDGYAGSGGSRSGGGGTPGNSTPPVIKTNFDLNSCVKRIYDALMAQNTLSNMTYYFMGVNSTDLIWNIGVLPSTEDGITESDINKPGIINITLSSTMTNKASGVYIATVMFHEALHAEMLRVIRAHGGIIRDDDPFLYDRYKIYANDKTYDTPEHNDIAYNYRQQIIRAVNDYDAACNKPLRDQDELDALSWAGLMDTQAYADFLNITKNPISGIKDSAYRLILSRLSTTKEANDKNTCDGKTNNTYLEE